MVKDSYSLGSISSSLSTGSSVLTLNFLTRTFLVDMVAGGGVEGGKPAENPQKKSIKSYTRACDFDFDAFEG